MPTSASNAPLSAAEVPAPDRHLPFYGLVSPPFRSGPDPGRLWLGNTHRVILDTLARAIRDDDGIALLTGDAGTGKTSLAERLIAMLGPAGITVGRVSSPGPAPSDFFEAVLSAYGVRRPVHDHDTFRACFRDVLARAAAGDDKVLLVVDEAQGLGHELLREIGELSAMAAASGDPLVVLLVGETRLTAAVQDDRHAALRERIIARCAVPPLGPDEVGAYVRHYLDAAGAVTEVFSPEAIRTIASLSRGAPGAINIIGDRALLVGRARRARPITEAIVNDCGRPPGSPSVAPAAFDRSSPRGDARRARARGRTRLYVTIATTVLFVTGAPYLAWWLIGLGGSLTADGLRQRVAPTPRRPGARRGIAGRRRRRASSRRRTIGFAAVGRRRPPSPPRAAGAGEGCADRGACRDPDAAPGVEAAGRGAPRAAGGSREPGHPRYQAARAHQRARAGRDAGGRRPGPRAPEARADTPDPSAIIDWLMKESPGRR